MYLNPVNRRWYQPQSPSLCQEPQSYKMNINDTQTKRPNNTHNSRSKCKGKPPVKVDL